MIRTIALSCLIALGVAAPAMAQTIPPSPLIKVSPMELVKPALERCGDSLPCKRAALELGVKWMESIQLCLKGEGHIVSITVLRTKLDPGGNEEHRALLEEADRVADVNRRSCGDLLEAIKRRFEDLRG